MDSNMEEKEKQKIKLKIKNLMINKKFKIKSKKGIDKGFCINFDF